MLDRRILLNGVKVHPFISGEELLAYAEKEKGILIAINAEKILHATEQTREIINRNIGYCDGMGAVMAMKKKGYKDVVKIPGCELWLKIIASLYQSNKSFYLVGGKQEVIEGTVNKLKNEFEGIQIVNYRNGYIQTEEEREALIEDVVKKKPDVVFVAMGSPKQELLMEEMLAKQIKHNRYRHHFCIFAGYRINMKKDMSGFRKVRYLPRPGKLFRISPIPVVSHG